MNIHEPFYRSGVQRDCSAQVVEGWKHVRPCMKKARPGFLTCTHHKGSEGMLRERLLANQPKGS